MAKKKFYNMKPDMIIDVGVLSVMSTLFTSIVRLAGVSDGGLISD